jgi:hypothetical protein
VTGVLGAVDRVRAIGLRRFGPAFRPLLVDRDRRVAVYGVLGAGVALTLTALAPVHLLAFGPLLLGVPHLLADVRYLVARPALHRRRAFWIFCAAPAMAAWVWPHASLGAVAVAGAALSARTRNEGEGDGARTAVYAVAGAILVLGLAYESAMDLVVAHAHNLVAVALFAVWSRGRRGLEAARLAPVVAFVFGAAALLGGAFDAAAGSRLAQGPVDPHASLFTLAPLSDPVWAMRLLLVFAFAQSMHYAVWLRLVPEVDRERQGIRSFTSSFRALRADVGRPVLVASGVLAAAILLWSFRSLEAARLGYLRLAMFHGPLELGAATLLLLEGRLPQAGSAAPPTGNTSREKFRVPAAVTRTSSSIRMPPSGASASTRLQSTSLPSGFCLSSASRESTK